MKEIYDYELRKIIIKKKHLAWNLYLETLNVLADKRECLTILFDKLFELTEKHLFPDHHKRKFNDDEVVNDQPSTLEPILESKENLELNLHSQEDELLSL